MTGDTVAPPRERSIDAPDGGKDRAVGAPDASDLPAVRDAAFALLGRGVGDRRSPFHTPVLVTNGLDGFPAARTVVLRGFDRERRHLSMHTDRRSAKVGELSVDDRAALVFYDARQRVQLRVNGRARVHHGDDVAAAAWGRLSPLGRRCYLGEPPGSPSPLATSGLPADVVEFPPSPERSEAGFANFTVVTLTMLSMDWLSLRLRGHRRARFAWSADSADAWSTWLAP